VGRVAKSTMVLVAYLVRVVRLRIYESSLLPNIFLANTTKAQFSQDTFQKEDAVPITTHLLPFPRSGPRASTDGL
jgi:hypothetical protein